MMPQLRAEGLGHLGIQLVVGDLLGSLVDDEDLVEGGEHRRLARTC